MQGALICAIPNWQSGFMLHQDAGQHAQIRTTLDVQMTLLVLPPVRSWQQDNCDLGYTSPFEAWPFLCLRSVAARANLWSSPAPRHT